MAAAALPFLTPAAAGPLNAYLARARQGALSRAGRLCVVVGTEASDLDSMVCSIAYARLLSLQQGDAAGIALPLLSIPRADLPLRTEARTHGRPQFVLLRVSTLPPAASRAARRVAAPAAASLATAPRRRHVRGTQVPWLFRAVGLDTAALTFADELDAPAALVAGQLQSVVLVGALAPPPAALRRALPPAGPAAAMRGARRATRLPPVPTAGRPQPAGGRACGAGARGE